MYRAIGMSSNPTTEMSSGTRAPPERSALSAPIAIESLAANTAGQMLLEASPRPTAVFAANDSMAIGALSALRSGGARVPEDISVVGFDDIPMARYMNPPLSTVQVDISALGVRAVERLLGHVRGSHDGARQRELVPAQLVVRSSSGSPAA